MKNIYKLAAMISAIIAALLMLIGIIGALAQITILTHKPNTLYYAGMNFILFAIFLFLVYVHHKEKPPVA
jgi:Ca2+/Na+ antiporter